MSSELHERARLLVDRSLVEETSEEERRWLNRHLADCAECGRYVELSRRTVRALHAFAFDVDAAGPLRAQEAIRAHAVRLASAESRRRDFAMGFVAALALTVIGSAAVWVPAEWLAARWHWPAHVWQIVFAVLWLLPSLMLTGLLLFRRRLVGPPRPEGDAV